MLGDRIKQLRYARGYSLRALAEKAGCVSAQAISNYENDKDTPGSSVLLALANALGTSVSNFFRRIEVSLGEPAYRKSASMTETRRLSLESSIALSVERHLETEQLFSLDVHYDSQIPSEAQLPVESIPDAEDRAERLRLAWGLQDYPIENLTELLEERGILVVSLRADDDFDGCTFPESEIPVVVVNGNRTGDRLRFDLAHELGHCVLRFADGWTAAQKEKAAHRFAGALLAPASAVRRELGEHRTRLSVLELSELKLKYGLSVQAWIHRAHDLGILSDSAYRSMWQLLSARGLLREEVGEPYPVERTSRQRRLVARAYADGLISESRAAELLGLSISEVPAVLMQSTDPVPQADASALAPDTRMWE